MKKGVANREKRSPRRQYGDSMITRPGITGETFNGKRRDKSLVFYRGITSTGLPVKGANNVRTDHFICFGTVFCWPAVQPLVLWLLSPADLSLRWLRRLGNGSPLWPDDASLPASSPSHESWPDGPWAEMVTASN